MMNRLQINSWHKLIASYSCLGKRRSRSVSELAGLDELRTENS